MFLRPAVCQIQKVRYSSSWSPLPLLDKEVLDTESGELPKPLLGGGRSSVSGVIATVFGASGCVGRVVVNRLGRVGSSVIAPYRGEANNVRFLKVMGDLGQVVPVPFDIRNEESVANAIQHSNVVINCLGRAYSTRNFSAHQANAESAETIARLSAEMGVPRLIHLSALGVHGDQDGGTWATAKRQGEQVVKEYFPDATIIRPAQILGYSDRLLMKFANLIRFHATFPVPSPGRRFQPVFSQDVATAIIQCLHNPISTKGRTYELAGPDVFTHREFVDQIGELLQISTRHGITPPDFVIDFATKLFYERWRSPAFVQQELDWFRSGDCLPNPNALSFSDLGMHELASVSHDAFPLIQLFQYPKGRYLV